MAKGDDAVWRKRNKASRKKMRHKDSSSVSNRVASIIAAKKRRKSGKRRICQGMCFSLPTPEDPFNERHGILDFTKREIKKLMPSKLDGKVVTNGKRAKTSKGSSGENHANLVHQEKEMANMKNLVNEQTMSVSSIDDAGKKNVVKPGKTKIQLIKQTGVACPQEEQDFEQPGCPSKFLMMCLNSIQNTLQQDGFISNEDDKPLFSDSWGIEFWKCYSIGKDILETSGTCSTIKQIAWMAATATDNIARKDKEGLSMTSPFLLFLVPSQEKAIEVRSACKPLKAHGIHTVSLHPGASIDHQVLGLKSCEPEFLVSTPERLLELASLKAIDISGVSLLVVDGLDMFIKDGHVDIVNSIKQSISLSPQTVVFSDSLTNASRTVVQNILGQSICRLSLNNSIASQGACIVQSVHICAFREEKLLKGIEILDQACGDWLHQQISKVLFIGGKDCNFAKLVPPINSKGYFVSTNSDYCNSVVENSESRPEVSIMDAKCISTTDLEECEIVICSDLGHSIDNYIQILTRMARYTVSGVLHSFLTAEDAMLMGPLVEILEKCGQEVPEALRNLCHSTQVPEH